MVFLILLISGISVQGVVIGMRQQFLAPALVALCFHDASHNTLMQKEDGFVRQGQEARD